MIGVRRVATDDRIFRVRIGPSYRHTERQKVSMTQDARAFFEACETGKGWAECAQYCEPTASFSCQSGALAETHTIEVYAGWMKGLLGPLPDGRYELKGFAADTDNDVVLAFAVFHGTHRRRWPCRAHRQERSRRLRLLHGVRWRKNRTHDKNLERFPHTGSARLGIIKPDLALLEGALGAVFCRPTC
jgi:hypothetical protein